MDAALKAKWIAALRSEKYPQGDGLLKDQHDCYCCLGVLAAIKGCTWRTDDDYGFIPVFGDDDVGKLRDLEAYLDPDFAGLSFEEQRTLADMNDSGKPFSQIADYIESEIPAALTQDEHAND